MKYIVGGGSYAVGLGDYLCLTALCRHLEDVEVHIHPKASEWLPLFKYIAKAEVVSPATHSLGYGPGHLATRLLRLYQLADKDPLPSIALCGHEIATARELLGQFNKPVAIGVNGSVHWKHRNELPTVEPWEEVVKQNAHRDFIQFGTGQNFTPVNGAKAAFVDMDIRDVAAMFCVIGTFVGISTGLEHLMVSVGGNTIVALPKDSPTYKREMWVYQSPRCQYVDFEDVPKIKV